jgi:hypothetical protein
LSGPPQTSVGAWLGEWLDRDKRLPDPLNRDEQARLFRELPDHLASMASNVLAGQNVGIKEVADRIWLVGFMEYDLGVFDHETCRLESAENPFGANVSPMCSA